MYSSVVYLFQREIKHGRNPVTVIQQCVGLVLLQLLEWADRPENKREVLFVKMEILVDASKVSVPQRACAQQMEWFLSARVRWRRGRVFSRSYIP